MFLSDTIISSGVFYMDNTQKLKIEMEAVDRFLNEYGKTGKSDVSCPFCGTKLAYKEMGSSYEVACQTPGCLKADFRGI